MPERTVLGRMGEHNASELVFTPPAELSEEERTDHYRVAFFTGGKTYLSEMFNEIPFTVPMWRELTGNARMCLQIIAYDENREFVGKSKKIGGFYFEPSVSETAVELGGENPDIASEIIHISEAVQTEKSRAEAAETVLSNSKVDKVSGKGLSSNDFTDAEKLKLASLENYNDTTALGRISQTESDIESLENSKVDKVNGKELSSNDYSDTDKAKLAKLKKDIFFGTSQKTGSVHYVTTDEDFELRDGVFLVVKFDQSFLRYDKLNVNGTGNVDVGIMYNMTSYEMIGRGVGTFVYHIEHTDGYPDSYMWFQTNIHMSNTDRYGMVKLSDSVNGDTDLRYGALAATPAAVKTVNDKITSAEAKIPSQASAQNQLADKAFVTSAIQNAVGTAESIIDEMDGIIGGETE